MTNCGYVATIGRPNAGKSSLLNWLVQDKVAMVSHKANATRKRMNIIVMHENTQLVFVDTPGIHQAEKLLNQYMLEEALKAIGDCDLVLFLAPVTDRILYYEEFLEKNRQNKKHIVLLTKTDFVTNAEVLAKVKEYEKYEDTYEALIPVSVKKGAKQYSLLQQVAKFMPESPFLYDTEISTDSLLRDIYKEFIREAIFDNISDEIPYEADVIIDRIEEKSKIDVIKAKIVVQKDSQKGMIIGKNAEAIKRIGKSARYKIQGLSNKQAFLELFVVVKKGWTKDKKGLTALGYNF
jgi:GTP-binding protein Era